MKWKMKNPQKKKVFVIATILIFFSYILFMNDVYTSDHIDLFQNPIQIGNLKEYLSTGRFMNLFINIFYFILNKFSISHLENQWVIQSLFIIFLGLSITELYDIFKKNTNQTEIDYILILMLSICFINPFFVEGFVYKGAEWGLAIWMTILATKALMQNKIIKSCILLFMAVSIYQSYIALFLIFYTGIMIVKYMGKVDKGVVIEYIKMVVIALGVAVVNIVIVKLAVMFDVASAELKGVKISGDFFSKIIDMLINIKNVLMNGFFVLPKAAIILIVAFIVACVLVYAIIEKKEMVKCFFVLVGMGLLCVYPFAITFVMRKIYLPPRVCWPVFASISICFVIMYKYMEYKKVIGILVGGVFTLLFASTQTCILDQYISNALDKYYMEVVYEEIVEYEEESGKEITDIYVIHALDQKYYHYSEMHYGYVSPMYSHKMQYDIWADVELLNYVSGRNFTDHYVEQSKQTEYFGDSTGFVVNTSEQLKFEDNSMYWLIY